MIYCSRLSRVVAVGVMTISCSTVTQVEPADRRLTLIDLAVPATVESAQPLHVQIQYGIGSCETVTAVSGQMTAPDRLEIEVRARYELPVRSTGCPDILFHRDTSLTLVAPQAGALAVVGLQPDGDPIERSVTVSPPGS